MRTRSGWKAGSLTVQDPVPSGCRFLPVEAVRQQTISVVPEVHVRDAREPLGCGVPRGWCTPTVAGAPKMPLRCRTHTAIVPVSSSWCHGAALLLVRPAQPWVAKSPNHRTKVEEKRAHDHEHEAVGLRHGFGDRRRHLSEAALATRRRPECRVSPGEGRRLPVRRASSLQGWREVQHL